MLNKSKLLDIFWKEVVYKIVYNLNRGHLKVNNDKTPYELWKGKPVIVKHFKVFGSKCYIKNNDEHLGKYDDRADEGVFLGYATNSKGYRCYNKRLNKMVDCIDIKVDEGSHVKDTQINNDESCTEDTTEEEQEQVQESEREEFELENEEADPQQQSVRPPPRIIQKNHPASQIIGD